MNNIDFTNCQQLMDKAYNGANGSKISILYNNDRYMLKFPPSAARKPTELSYTNSCISEHIGSYIFNSVGVAAQQTLLGTYRINGKEKVVCACKDFSDKDNVFFDFASIKNTIIDSVHNGTGTELEDIIETIEKQSFVEPQYLLNWFWHVFVVDALIGNFDRHNGNWGFLINSELHSSTIAPIFDCGSSLLPQADESTMRRIIANQDEMNARVYNFPTSAIKLNNTKINYYDFLSACQIKEVKTALQEIVPKINLNEIKSFITSIQLISSLQKEFFNSYLEARYNKILLPAYQNCEINTEELDNDLEL